MKRCPLTQEQIAMVLHSNNSGSIFSNRLCFTLGYEEALNAPGQITAQDITEVELRARIASAKPVAVIDGYLEFLSHMNTHELCTYNRGKHTNEGTLVVWPKETSGHPPKD